MRLFIFLPLLLLIACANDPKEVQEFITDEEQVIEQLKEAELLHTENGKIKVRIVAAKIKRFQNKEPKLVFSDKIKVLFYDDSSQVQTTLIAENATINEQEKLMTAYDNVMLISSDAKKLETEELVWDEKANKIYTDKKVKITTGKEVIHGEGFLSNPDFTAYSITKIHGTFNFESEND